MWAAPAWWPISARSRIKSRRTCAGLAWPVVSDRPTSSAPAAAHCTARRITSSSGTAPCKVQPKAVEIAASRPTCGATRRRSASISRTSSTIACGLLRTLAMECAGLAETGTVILCTPAARAASAPRRLGTSASTVRPGSVSACATTAAVSASCGSRRAGTKEPTSISRRPAACSALIQRSLSAVGMQALTDCRPSLGPTSLIRTVAVFMALFPTG